VVEEFFLASKHKVLEYSVNQVPPAGHLLVSSIQHVLLMFVSLGFPVIFSSQISGTAEFAASFIAFSMLAAGIGSVIQSVGLPFIGSKYLCPNPQRTVSGWFFHGPGWITGGDGR